MNKLLRSNMSMSQGHVSSAARNSLERRCCFPALFSAAHPCDVIARRPFLLLYVSYRGAVTSSYARREVHSLVNNAAGVSKGCFVEAAVIAPVVGSAAAGSTRTLPSEGPAWGA